MSDQVIITIRDTTFQLPRQYFVSLQLDAGEKVRTEVCEVPSETPAFHKNQFTFWVHGGLSAEHNLTLGAFVVMEEGKEPQALGNCTLSLGSLGARLIATSEPIVSNLTFMRRKGEADLIPVGKISVQVQRPPTRAWLTVAARAAHGLPKRADGSAPTAQLNCSVQTQQVAPVSPLGRDTDAAAGEIPVTTVMGTAKSAVAAADCAPRWNELLELTDELAPASNSSNLICFEVMDVESDEHHEPIARFEVPLQLIVPYQSYSLLLECQSMVRIPSDEPPADDAESPPPAAGVAGSTALLVVSISTRDRQAQYEHMLRLTSQKLELLDGTLVGLDADDGTEVVAVCELVVKHQIKTKVAMLRRGGSEAPHGPFTLCRAQRADDRFSIDLSRLQQNRKNCSTLETYRKATLAAPCRRAAPDRTTGDGTPGSGLTMEWLNETLEFPVGAGFHHSSLPGALSYPESLEGSGDDAPILLVQFYASGKAGAEPPTATAADDVRWTLVAYAVVQLPREGDGSESVPIEAPVVRVAPPPAADDAAVAPPLEASDEAVAPSVGTFSATVHVAAAAASTPPAAAVESAPAGASREPAPDALIDLTDPELVSQTEYEPVETPAVTRGRGAEDDALKMRVQLLTDNLAQKQAAVEDLSSNVDRHAHALRTCGEEIVQLRRQKLAVEAERDRLAEHIRARRESEKRDLRKLELGQPLVSQSPEHALEQLRLVRGEYERLRAEHGDLAKQFGASAKVLEEFVRLKAAHAELEKAHTIQAAYVQKLQSSQGKIDAYKATITMQEKVIAKLEELMQANLSGGHQHRSLGSSLQQRPSSKARVEIDEGATAAKDARIKLLEEQMVENAREASKENAALKLRIFELEMSADMR